MRCPTARSQAPLERFVTGCNGSQRRLFAIRFSAQAPEFILGKSETTESAMNKLFATLIAGLFATAAFAQTATPAAPATPAEPAAAAAPAPAAPAATAPTAK